MLRHCITLFLLLFSLFGNAQQTDQKLAGMVHNAIKGFNGTIGIYIKNLKTGKTVTINADTVFATASIIKVPILIGIMDKIRNGVYHYDSSVIYYDSLYYAGEDILGEFKNGGKLRLQKLMMLMLTTSDNTASLWLQKLAGTGTRINELLDSLGYPDTKVNSRTPGRKAFQDANGWGQTTPREMARIFEDIYRNKIFSPAACERMQRCLGRNLWDTDEGTSQVPPYIEVYSKNGCVDENRNEILLVNAPNQPYIFSIFTKDNKDTSWNHQNEAWVLTRKLSAILWHYFEPKDKWVKPASEGY
ncbi:class A beta-lactamase-related serine hydrolase [Niabella pedocola]|uniref:beta-lactamase n=1 Tax=Niabella pedocola TaxID=1752077 RepID=A0ABS8PTB0_9BACT|nr:serine hydrolase [Niabella pedocola]MCD2424302.1 class A beta-lactamase-related serine hydrolase [Niabella pedocola]